MTAEPSAPGVGFKSMGQSGLSRFVDDRLRRGRSSRCDGEEKPCSEHFAVAWSVS
jgi:hypothetical protein